MSFTQGYIILLTSSHHRSSQSDRHSYGEMDSWGDGETNEHGLSESVMCGECCGEEEVEGDVCEGEHKNPVSEEALHCCPAMADGLMGDL